MARRQCAANEQSLAIGDANDLSLREQGNRVNGPTVRHWMLQHDVTEVVHSLTGAVFNCESLCRQFDDIRGIDPFLNARLELHEDHGDAVMVRAIHANGQIDGRIDRE